MLKRVLEIAALLWKNLEENDGSSINAHGEAPKYGYMVSIEGDERTYKGIALEKLQIELINYITDYIDILRTHDLYYFGVWYDAGTYYLDISVNIDDFMVATSKALENHQEAIYDVEQDICFYKHGLNYLELDIPESIEEIEED